MSGSGQEAHPHVQEWSGSPPGCLGVVGRPSRMSESVLKVLRMSGSGRDALPDVRECSRSPPRSPEVVGRPTQMFESGRKAFPDVQV